MRNSEFATIAVIGLGYVGLPLAVQLSTKYQVVGFDLSELRIRELAGGHDRTGEVSDARLQSSRPNLEFTHDIDKIRNRDAYIVAVPTPITPSRSPDLRFLEGASRTVGHVLSPGAFVVYESTVYPGCTEEFCVPIIEEVSGFRLNSDFFVGYSPERINPGDSVHTVDTITKVTSGSSEEAAIAIDHLYSSVISAGTYRASSIRVAEAAKVIENSQRDLNIAFVNELALIFNKMGLDTTEVLTAAGTKWNFLPFRPGLVGGHCIGVDPYYLTHKAQEVGYHPEIILAGRRLNDSMGSFVAAELVKLMIKRGRPIAQSDVLILGITFKENCPDIRNTRVVDVVRELEDYGCNVSIFDPWADRDEVEREYGLSLIPRLDPHKKYAGVILAVGHQEFLDLTPRHLIEESGSIYDAKSIWPKEAVDQRL